jgi:hypothetical protein
MNDENPEYDIGYKKPPKATQFKAGISGNPKGRRKGKANVATILKRALEEKVVINENGVRKTVTKLDAAIKQLANKAASGDLAALRQLMALTSVLDQSDDSPKAYLDDADEKVMQRVLSRLAASTKGEEDNENR